MILDSRIDSLVLKINFYLYDFTQKTEVSTDEKHDELYDRMNIDAFLSYSDLTYERFETEEGVRNGKV